MRFPRATKAIFAAAAVFLSGAAKAENVSFTLIESAQEQFLMKEVARPGTLAAHKIFVAATKSGKELPVGVDVRYETITTSFKALMDEMQLSKKGQHCSISYEHTEDGKEERTTTVIIGPERSAWMKMREMFSTSFDKRNVLSKC